MSTVQGGFLGLVIATSCAACMAQNQAIPFKQMEQNGQLSARVVALPPPNGAPVGKAYEPAAAMPGAATPAASGLMFGPPMYKPPRTLSTSFFLVNGLHLGLAMLDIATTQHCIADGHCREGNPMMPSSLGGQLVSPASPSLSERLCCAPRRGRSAN